RSEATPGRRRSGSRSAGGSGRLGRRRGPHGRPEGTGPPRPTGRLEGRTPRPRSATRGGRGAEARPWRLLALAVSDRTLSGNNAKVARKPHHPTHQMVPAAVTARRGPGEGARGPVHGPPRGRGAGGRAP